MKSKTTVGGAGSTSPASACSALRDCHDCGAKPGQPHRPGCDTEQCSVCGGQRLQCRCKGHDRAFARWTGIWPGAAESAALGIDLNEFHRRGLHRLFFVKPNKFIQAGTRLAAKRGAAFAWSHVITAHDILAKLSEDR